MPVTTSTGVVLLEELTLRNGRHKSMLDMVDALAGPPTFTLTMDGACTLEVDVADASRKLTRSPLVGEKSWSEVLGVRFELAAVSKNGDRVRLTYEDGVTAALRRRDERLVIPRNSSIRAHIAQRLAAEANVKADVDPAKRDQVHHAVERGGKNGPNSWDLLGDLAEEVHWRRFSTGTRLVFGSDDWLMDDARGPARLTENTGAVKSVDFDLDAGKRASRATVYVDATVWALPPGQLVILGDDMGPAAGKWLVQTFTRTLSSTQATVTLTRERHSLKEPKAAASGERGEPDFLPGVGDGTATGTAGSGARERMVAFALAQRGKPYIYGASGPGSYDCSGLVQAATAAAGKMLPKPSANQAAIVRDHGTPLSIDTAIRTRGALLFRIGVSSYNHVVISLGNGSTIEAMGSAYGVCIGSAAGRGWTSAGLWI